MHTCGLTKPTFSSLRPGPDLLNARCYVIGSTITERHLNICSGRMRGSWAQYPNQDHIARFAPKRKGCNIRRG